ncbi:MAG: hypothetical protein P1V81_14460 [Planctomycetota bacterium]|nr:hypothetical protein [Planctomycetota bacterium]
MRLVHANLAGLVIGSIVNMGLIMTGPSVIPLPEGVDPADMESLEANMHLFEARHFLFPWLAHALGTLAGALVAGTIATTKKAAAAWFIGCFFLLGGAANAFMLPAPAWFLAADLLGAYLPMAWIATKVVGKGSEPA